MNAVNRESSILGIIVAIHVPQATFEDVLVSAVESSKALIRDSMTWDRSDFSLMWCSRRAKSSESLASGCFRDFIGSFGTTWLDAPSPGLVIPLPPSPPSPSSLSSASEAWVAVADSRAIFSYSCKQKRLWLWYHEFYKTWWRHQMETFSALLALCAGNLPGNSPVTLICAMNKQFSKQSSGWWFETPSRSLWCHRNGWWRRDMKHIPHYWSFRGHPPVTDEFPTKLATMRVLNVFCFFIFNKLLNTQSSCWWFESLWR